MVSSGKCDRRLEADVTRQPVCAKTVDKAPGASPMALVYRDTIYHREPTCELHHGVARRLCQGSFEAAPDPIRRTLDDLVAQGLRRDHMSGRRPWEIECRRTTVWSTKETGWRLFNEGKAVEFQLMVDATVDASTRTLPLRAEEYIDVGGETCHAWAMTVVGDEMSEDPGVRIILARGEDGRTYRALALAADSRMQVMSGWK